MKDEKKQMTGKVFLKDGIFMVFLKDGNQARFQ